MHINQMHVNERCGKPDPLSHQIHVVEDSVGNCSSLLLCDRCWTRQVEEPEKLPVLWKPKRCGANCSTTNVCRQQMTIEVIRQSTERPRLQNAQSPKRLTEVVNYRLPKSLLLFLKYKIRIYAIFFLRRVQWTMCRLDLILHSFGSEG